MGMGMGDWHAGDVEEKGGGAQAPGLSACVLRTKRSEVK